MPDSEDKLPLLVHVHVPKTAGQSFMNRLFVEFGEDVLHLDYATDPASTGAEIAPNLPYLERLLRERPSTRAITLHCFRFEHPPKIGGRPCVYVTVLRDPFEQVLSWIRYIQTNFAQFPTATRTFLRLWPDTDRVTATEIADRLLNEHNPGRHAGGLWFLPTQFFGRAGDEVIGLLETFTCVGVMDRMDSSMRTMRHRLQPFGWSLNSEFPHLNRTSNASRSEPQLETYEPLRTFCATELADDHTVYRWARDRIEADLPTQPGDSRVQP